MTDNSDNSEHEQKRPLTLIRPGSRLELRKSIETSQVRQSFPHGRSKTVVVETVRKPRAAPGGAAGERCSEPRGGRHPAGAAGARDPAPPHRRGEGRARARATRRNASG